MSLSLSTTSSTSALLLRRTAAITDDEFREFRDFIYTKCGIWVDEKRKYLFENRFGKRLGELGLKTFSDYLRLLRHDPGREKELQQVYELVTTNETSLYRDLKQLDGFKAHILQPLLAEQRKSSRPELNIWSAGCSSGEEPYTLAIMLHEELGPDIKRWNIRITGCDLSPAVVAKAKAGIYSDYSFKTTPEIIKKKYFTPVPDGLKVAPHVSALTSFMTLNLNDTLAVKRIPKSHVVFCRNVIIYFDDAMKKKVVGSFYENLAPGGFLVLGHSETLHKISSAFRPKFISGAVAYQRI
jgi:chemotaxis protein methyltransferase CheR